MKMNSFNFFLRTICFVGVLFMTNVGKGLSQSEVSFDHITTNEGLSQNDINCIFQDKHGFMWFGTHDGLNKFDGYDFTVYNPDTSNEGSINSNLIYNIVGDRNSNLWIGTTGRGLNFFDRSTETFQAFTHEEGNVESLSNDHISDLFMDHRDRLWIGTNSGLNMLDLNKGLDSVVFQKYHLEYASYLTGWDGKLIYDVFEDNRNQLYVGGVGGLYKMSRDENGDIYFRSLNEALGLPEVIVSCIVQDKFGRLVVGTDNGLFIQEGGHDFAKVRKIAEGNYNTLLIDNQGNIWGGTYNGLLYFENISGNKPPDLLDKFVYNPLDESSISKNIIKSLFLDRSGIIWVGTNGGGINKFDPERKQFLHIRKTLDSKSLSYDKIRVMFEDSKGTLWIGTEGGGLNMMASGENDRSYDNFKIFQSVSKPFALEEIGTKDNRTLLIGVEGTPGLHQLNINDPDKIQDSDIRPFPDVAQSVFTLLEDSDGILWVGTYGGGLQRWTPKGNDFEKDIFSHNTATSDGISSDIIRNVFEDSMGNIWIATGNGLCKLQRSEKTKIKPRFEVFKNVPGNSRSLSHDYILAIYESRAGSLWIGTFGGGLNKFIPSHDGGPETFISYSESDGLPNNVIKGILEDENGNLWLSTNQGLSRFDPNEKIFTNYDVNDGLQSNEFQELACLKRADGEMLFGGVNGFNSFYPDDIRENKSMAETVITDFLISNQSVRVGQKVNGRPILKKTIALSDEIRLKYKENSFSFEFAALHYAAPRKNKFAYMLEGFDEDWIKTSSNKRFATYTNLEPGLYALKVKASNNDGLWDPTPTEMKIRIVPPFWRTHVAYGIYGLLALGLLWLFWRYTFIRTTEKHQLQLEHMEKEQYEELQRVKLEFFTNISHEFRTPLTLIKGPLEYLQKSGGNLGQKAVQEQYTLMHKNTNYLLRLVNQLLDFRKINQGKMRLVVRNTDIIAFIKEVIEPFQFLALKKMIHLEIESSHKNLLSWFDHEALEKIINNLLSNAFKFTPENGNIKISIGLENFHRLDYVSIRIKDSGEGIEKDKLEEIFRRFYVEKKGKKVNPEGMGIGLSFTKDLVELHQGRIEVTSEPGGGTEFTILLPAKKESYLNVDEITCKEASENDFLVRSSVTESFAIGINDELVDESLSKSRSKLPVLLIVDDNPDIRSFIGKSLENQYTICEAENGKQGLELANKVVPNVILSDVLMPVMDGIEFCNAVKTKEETSHIPIIMLTAKSSEESKLEGLKTGADDYLTKPFNMELLKLKLANIVKQRNELRKRFNRDIAIQPSEVTVTSTDEKFLNQAIAIVEKHMMNTDFNVEMMVKEMGLSRSNLYLKFKELTGLSSSEFIRNVRLKRAVQLFENSDLSVKEIMYMTGFNTASYFSKCFKKQFGVIPSEYVSKMKSTNEAAGL